MNFKKNTFASILFFIVITLSSCTSQTIDIEGTTKFSSIVDDNEPTQYHTVVYGDSLWDISYKYYDDPFVWPNIFKNNQNKIYDADLILPGQSLIIHRNISDKSRVKAREYAKTRGLWVVGYREESDIIFLENDKWELPYSYFLYFHHS